MPVERRTILIAIAVVLIVATGAATATGSLGAVPVVGPLVNSCGPGETRIAAVNDGGATGETVVVRGKLDFAHQVGDQGITAFELDGETGTVPVHLDEHPGGDLEFGDCLRVRGVVTDGDAKEEVDGPIVANATILNR